MPAGVHVNEQRQRAIGGRPARASAAFDWMLLVLVCAYFGWRLFFRTPPGVTKEGSSDGRRTEAEKEVAATRNPQGQASTLKAVPPTPPLAVATIIPAESVTGPAVTLEAQKRAMAIYPTLGVAGSPLNREFVARHKRYQTEKPDFFTDPEWPTKLATECAQAIGQMR